MIRESIINKFPTADELRNKNHHYNDTEQFLFIVKEFIEEAVEEGQTETSIYIRRTMIYFNNLSEITLALTKLGYSVNVKDDSCNNKIMTISWEENKND